MFDQRDEPGQRDPGVRCRGFIDPANRSKDRQGNFKVPKDVDDIQDGSSRVIDRHKESIPGKLPFFQACQVFGGGDGCVVGSEPVAHPLQSLAAVTQRFLLAEETVKQQVRGAALSGEAEKSLQASRCDCLDEGCFRVIDVHEPNSISVQPELQCLAPTLESAGERQT